MSATSDIATAKIYDFPMKPRASGAAASRRDDFAAVAELHGPRLPRMEFGSAWYHEAAMQEEAEAQRRDSH